MPEQSKGVVQVRRDEQHNQVVLGILDNGTLKTTITLSWRMADELYHANRFCWQNAKNYMAKRGEPDSHLRQASERRFGSYGSTLVVKQVAGMVEWHGRVQLLAEFNWIDAEAIGQAVYNCARVCDEHEHAQKIIMDGALIARSGAIPGLGLSNNPKIQDEVKKEAQHDRELRRAIPSIRSKEVFGVPKIGIGLRPFDKLRALSARMSPEEKRLLIGQLSQP